MLQKNLKKYFKHLNRLFIEDEVLCRLFYNDAGKIEFRQYCPPKDLWKETLYRIHNSQTAGHIGNCKTIQEFRRRFYFPGFTENLFDFIKNCLTCLHLKKLPSFSLKPPLHQMSFFSLSQEICYKLT